MPSQSGSDVAVKPLSVVAQRAARGIEHQRKRTLTRAERSVIQVLSDPALYRETATERIAAAGVSRDRYYKIMKNPDFRQLQRDFVHDMIRERVAPVIGAALDTASVKGRDGHNDRDMVLQMAGLYTPKQQTDLHVTGEAIIAVAGVNIDDV